MSPIRIDFYLLTSSDQQERWLTACRLLEKAYFRGHRIFVFCDHQKDAELIDELLWTFKEESFIPHNLQGEGPEPPPPIQIGYGSDCKGYQDILMNLSSSIPRFSSSFKRIIEIVSNEDRQKEQSRSHYREYRAMGYDLHTHQL